jgi:hypothetical protein
VPDSALWSRTKLPVDAPTYRCHADPPKLTVATWDPAGVWPWLSTQNMISWALSVVRRSYAAWASVPLVACIFSAYGLVSLDIELIVTFGE